jgi:hypothetical protein
MSRRSFNLNDNDLFFTFPYILNSEFLGKVKFPFSKSSNKWYVPVLVFHFCQHTVLSLTYPSYLLLICFRGKSLHF